MGATGSTVSPGGGAPLPEPERVAMIRYTIVDEAETCAAFAEPARAALADLNHRALAEARSGDLSECGLLLDHVRDRIAGLDPARLEPRGGLAGLFDSRGRRLKAFRAAYASAASAVAQSAAEIGERAGVLARKDMALETLWSETRDAIAELDAHIAAARAWLSHETPAPAGAPAPLVEADALQRADEAVETLEAEAEAAAPPEPSDAMEPVAEAVSGTVQDAEPAEPPPPDVALQAEVEPVTTEAAPEPAAEPEPTPEREITPEPAPVSALPHPLATRLAALEAVRATAIGRLPLLRAAQNADCRAPAALKQVCDGVEAWRAEWQDALGLAGKRPKTVRPDRQRLAAASADLSDRIRTAGRELTAVQARRAELDARSTPAKSTPALAA